MTDDWTPWQPLQACLYGTSVPAAPGLYRLRADGDTLVAYIGQTGRSLREKLRALRGIYGADMPYRDPHTAGPALWAWMRTSQIELEASVRIVTGSVTARKAAEAVAVSEYRQKHGVSPRWNFGRMPAGFLMSSGNNSNLVAAGRRFRGGPTEEVLSSHAPGIPPRRPLDSEVQSPSWAGHTWSDCAR